MRATQLLPDVGQSLWMGIDGGEAVLNEFANAGVDVGALATRLQDEGADSFDKSWNDLLRVISSKSAALRSAA